MKVLTFKVKTCGAALVALACAGALLAYARAQGAAGGPYELADDCPRGALVYAQFSDLPALVGRWNDSDLKRRYLDSTNFRQFKNGHVALKLLSRLAEFEEAAGFPVDAGSLAGAVDKSAAVAVYDIGRLEMVFVARVGEEKALASRFFAAAQEFEATELPGGLTYYGREVAADRGRQRQRILFAFARGRFVLATGEQLMLRALANLEGKARGDRLSDDPSFRTLSKAVAPHLLTVWVDQAKLNDDWYFKRYWAMRNVARLKPMRAGIFDFEAREGGWLERREFLLRAGREMRPRVVVSAHDRRELTAALPPGAAYERLRVADGADDAARLVRDAVLDRLPLQTKDGAGRRLYDDYYFEGGGEGSSGGESYLYLGDEYELSVDDAEEADAGRAGAAAESEARATAGVVRALAPAAPVLAGAAESPVADAGPLFAEFRRAAVVTLRRPAALDPQAFEQAVSALVVGPLTVAGEGARVEWEDAGEGALRWRELRPPSLGWKVCYALKGRALVVANDAGLLAAALAGGGGKASPAFARPDAPDDLTVIRFDEAARSFAPVMGRLDAARVKEYWQKRGGREGVEPASEEFMSGNVASLLDVAAPVGRVEIRRRASAGRLRVELEIFLKQPADE